MRQRLVVYGATEPALQLLPALARRRDLELAAVFDPDARALRRRLALIEPGAARLLQSSLCDDLETFARTPAVDLAIDGGLQPGLHERLHELGGLRGVEVSTPEAASRRLGLSPSPWCEPVAPPVGRATRLDAAIDAALRARAPFVLWRCLASAPATGSAPDAPGETAAVRERIVACLRPRVTGDDVLQPAADGSVLALWIDPARASAERRIEQARAAAEAVAEALRDASPRPSLAFGYALHPEDGRDRKGLLARAAIARIRTL